MANSSDLVAVMAELHAALKPGDLEETLRRVTEAAVELLPDVEGATITVEHRDNRFETAAAAGSLGADPEPAAGGDTGAPELTAEAAARLDRLQRGLNEGPAVDVVDSREISGAFTGAAESRGSDPMRNELEDPADAAFLEPGQAPAVTTSDLSDDERYPAYGALAMSSGVRAQVAVMLFDTARARGVLNLYSRRVGAFDDTAVLTDLFAHHSATALAYAAEYQDREAAVAGRRAVGQALGIVMERFNVSEAQAFALLQRAAQRRSVGVRLVAQELIAQAEDAGSHDGPANGVGGV